MSVALQLRRNIDGRTNRTIYGTPVLVNVVNPLDRFGGNIAGGLEVIDDVDAANDEDLLLGLDLPDGGGSE